MPPVFMGNPFMNLPTGGAPVPQGGAPLPAGLMGGTLPLNLVPSPMSPVGIAGGGGVPAPVGGGGGGGVPAGSGVPAPPRVVARGDAGAAGNALLAAAAARGALAGPPNTYIGAGTPGGAVNTTPELDIYRTQGAGLTPEQLIAYGFLPPPNPLIGLGQGFDVTLGGSSGTSSVGSPSTGGLGQGGTGGDAGAWG